MFVSGVPKGKGEDGWVGPEEEGEEGGGDGVSEINIIIIILGNISSLLTLLNYVCLCFSSFMTKTGNK